MKKKTLIIVGVVAAVAIVVCVCLFLTFCTGEKAGLRAFTGEWSAASMQQDDAITTEEDMALFRSIGLDVTLSLRDDLSATLSLFGAESSGTWQPESGSAATMSLNNEEIDLTMEDGQLKMQNNETTIVFVHSDEIATPESNTQE